jgi:hypothetical protein
MREATCYSCLVGAFVRIASLPQQEAGPFVPSAQRDIHSIVPGCLDFARTPKFQGHGRGESVGAVARWWGDMEPTQSSWGVTLIALHSPTSRSGEKKPRLQGVQSEQPQSALDRLGPRKTADREPRTANHEP